MNNTIFDLKEVEDISKASIKNKTKTYLVKDTGLYIMTDGPDGKNAKESGLVVYAKGCNPDTDEDYYENSRFLAGGDDFGEEINLDAWLTARKKQINALGIKKNLDKFILKITETEITLLVS